MKETNQNKSDRKRHSGHQKGIIIGPLVGAFLGFIVPFLVTGESPFTERYTMGLGDMSGIVRIFLLYIVIGGAVLGFIVGIVIGLIIDLARK